MPEGSIAGGKHVVFKSRDSETLERRNWGTFVCINAESRGYLEESLI